MAKQNGIRKRVFDLLNEDPKQLWSIPEMLEKFPESTYKAIDTHFRVLRVDGRIDRHIDRDINGDFQFAVKVKIEKIDPYIKQERPSNSGPKKRKGKLLSSKEIRSMFAAHYNNMAKLEDSVMAIVEQFEETEKEMIKIRNFLK